jgi:nitrogen fixation NifU-like protein
MEKSLYKEELLEIYSEKPNYGKLKNKTHELKLRNPICDDEITLELKIKNGKIIDAKFYGVNCFVTTVSSSVLTEKIKGMKVEDALKLTKKDIDEWLGIKITPGRIRCELLALDALKKLRVNPK